MTPPPHNPGTIGSFRQAVEFLEQGIDYERTRKWQYNTRWLNLQRMNDLLVDMGNPHRRYQVIHVAGTKGKGSTAGAIASALQRIGLRTGLLTSPHLVTPRERICVDGKMIREEEFRRTVAKMQSHVECKRSEAEKLSLRAPTYFEMLTALAFDHFAQRQVDWAVVEVGLGGRLDSTNVVSPACCVITTIGFDHMEKLGNTPAAIAAEKAGILKEGVPVVLGRQRYPDALETLRSIARERGCPRWEVGREMTILEPEPLVVPAGAGGPTGWRFSLRTPNRLYDGLFTPLLGAHQLDNLAAAVGALEMMGQHAGLDVRPKRVADAIAEFRVPGRIELLQGAPPAVLDVAHNPESVQALLDALDTHLPGRPLHLAFGCSKDKDVRGMLKLLLPRCASFTATQARLQRAMPAEDVHNAAREMRPDSLPADKLRRIGDPWEAFENALRGTNEGEIACVTGSFFVAGEVRARWAKQPPDGG